MFDKLFGVVEFPASFNDLLYDFTQGSMVVFDKLFGVVEFPASFNDLLYDFTQEVW